MKILFSLTYYSPYVSGLSICVMRIAEGLSPHHTVRVLCMKHKTDLLTEEEMRNVRVVRAQPLIKISKGFLSVDWIIKSFQEVLKSDIVVVNLPQLEGIIPALLTKIFHKKLITIYHCDLKLSRGVLNSVAESFVIASNWVTLQLSDKVITYTEDFAKDSPMLSQFFKKGIFIYPPIIKPGINKRVQNSIREKIGSDNPFVIGIAVRLAAEKGIEYVLEAIKMLNGQCTMHNEKKKYKLVIAGPLDPVGEESYKVKIQNLVKKVKEDVVFLGTIKPEEMGSFYSLIDVLVLPSINSTESFGMVQVEAMMYGVPVIASNLPGVRVPVERTGMGEIVPIKNVSAIVTAIQKIISDKKKYIKEGKQIEKEFSYNQSIQNYQRTITSL